MTSGVPAALNPIHPCYDSHVLFDDIRFALEIGRRANLAAAGGEETFAVPELAPLAAKIADDPRAGTLGNSASQWESGGSRYHDLVRLAARYVLHLETLEPAEESVYVPKASSELEPLLSLWPDVIGLPTAEPITSRDLIALRAVPVHPLGIVAKPSWADGRMCSPAEFFFHDLDHARFKVREDLLALGIEISDAYHDGSTFDANLKSHRVILAEARGRIGNRLWRLEKTRSQLAHSLISGIDALPDRDLATAAMLVAFEVIHEKSFPLDRAVLKREAAAERHVMKLWQKCDHGFFGSDAPSPKTIARIEDAQRWLVEWL